MPNNKAHKRVLGNGSKASRLKSARAFLGIPSIAYGGVGAVYASAVLQPISSELSMLTGALGGATVLGGLAETIYKFRENTRAREHEPLDGVLELLFDVLDKRTTESPKGKLRVAIHVPCKNPGGNLREAIQLTDYVSYDPPAGAGRRIDISKGVTGTAFRTGLAQWAKLPRNTQLIDYYTSTHGYTRQEAVAMRQDRKSWAAFPIGDAPNVAAVIYFDSSSPDFFGRSGCMQRILIENSALAIAEFLAVR